MTDVSAWEMMTKSDYMCTTVLAGAAPGADSSFKLAIACVTSALMLYSKSLCLKMLYELSKVTTNLPVLGSRKDPHTRPFTALIFVKGMTSMGGVPSSEFSTALIPMPKFSTQISHCATAFSMKESISTVVEERLARWTWIRPLRRTSDLFLRQSGISPVPPKCVGKVDRSAWQKCFTKGQTDALWPPRCVSLAWQTEIFSIKLLGKKGESMRKIQGRYEGVLIKTVLPRSCG
mmetsp:Transcript_8365/g.20796  ORF Transcript_8365/g.20796 Transcript_8365/m.20796 type:complete len:233 (-) Transcript_8365:717-1415(-)